MSTPKNHSVFINIILSLILMLFIISASVVITLNFRPLYYFDIGHLDITGSTGLSKEEIRENYDELIDYNSIFHSEPLNFPSFPMSESGRIHFEEVKDIFILFQFMFAITFILSAVGIWYLLRKKSFLFLKLTSIFTVAIPAVLGLFIATNWDRAFIMFHKLAFNNDYWIFDYETDPVITILPDTFFLHCGVLILSGVVMGSLVCFILYRILKKKEVNHVTGRND